jgi:DNA primase
MAETWMTYADLAERLGVTAEAARQRAVRGRWRRQTGNDGKTLVLVEPDALAAKKRTPERRPDVQPNEHPDDARTVDALQAHIATLKDALGKAEGVAAAREDDLRRERERIDQLTGELLRLTGEAMVAAAARDDMKAEVDAMRARPWWKRLVG